jgi:hypothetical protein
VEKNPSGGLTWIGSLEQFEHSQVTLVIHDGVVIGNIALPAPLYQIRYVNEGIHVIHEIDTSMFPSD